MIIGISGKLGSGKSTLADMIIHNYKLEDNEGIVRKSFAGKLKYIVAYLAGIDEELTKTQEGKNTYLKEWGMTVGQFLQKMGTEGMRQGVHLNGWVLSLFSEYNPDKKDTWIITDVRFKNEAQAIRDRGGILIRIEGDPANINKNSTRELTHASEIDLDDWTDWDVYIDNNENLDDLLIQVKGFLYLLQTLKVDIINLKDYYDGINEEQMWTDNKTVKDCELRFPHQPLIPFENIEKK